MLYEVITFTEKMRESLTEMKQEILDKLIATNADFRAIVEEMDPRITSYNVCYTKLLRLLDTQASA